MDPGLGEQRQQAVASGHQMDPVEVGAEGAEELLEPFGSGRGHPVEVDHHQRGVGGGGGQGVTAGGDAVGVSDPGEAQDRGAPLDGHLDAKGHRRSPHCSTM